MMTSINCLPNQILHHIRLANKHDYYLPCASLPALHVHKNLLKFFICYCLFHRKEVQKNKTKRLIDTIASNNSYGRKIGLVSLTYSLSYSHTPILEMLSHLKIILQLWFPPSNTPVFITVDCFTKKNICTCFLNNLLGGNEIK